MLHNCRVVGGSLSSFSDVSLNCVFLTDAPISMANDYLQVTRSRS